MSITAGIRNKFGLNWVLTAQTSTQLPFQVRYPLTLELDITRNNYPMVNEGKLKIYNLSTEHRNFFQVDQYVGQYLAPAERINITLQAGYGDGDLFPVIFSGDIKRGYSVREGENFVTYLDAFDGGGAYSNSRSNITFNNDADQLVLIEQLINDLGPFGIRPGVISQSFAGKMKKGGSYSGNTVEILREITNGNFFIDNGRANVIAHNEAISIDDLLIDASFGLLNTPIKQPVWLEISLLFEPRLVIGSVVNLQAGTQQVYNGRHLVCSLHHKGTISGAISTETITTVGLQAGVFQKQQERALVGG